MPCDTKPFRYRQTLTERKAEVKERAENFAKRVTDGTLKVVVDKKTGAVAFTGLTEEERGGISDACIHRRLVVNGSMAVKLAIAKAEQMAGRPVSLQALAAGTHSHDGGATWHPGHK